MRIIKSYHLAIHLTIQAVLVVLFFGTAIFAFIGYDFHVERIKKCEKVGGHMITSHKIETSVCAKIEVITPEE